MNLCEKMKTRKKFYIKRFSKAWFPPMRLTYSHLYSYENKYNPIGGNASNNLKKIILQFSMRLFGYSHKNNMKMF